MKQDGDKDGERFKVEDDEGFVAREKKKIIIESRRRVDEYEEELLTVLQRPIPRGRDTETVQEERKQQIAGVWHGMVRQYVRNIVPLLENDEIEGATHAYKQAHLGGVRLEPPSQYKAGEVGYGGATAGDTPDIVLHRFSDVPEPVVRDIYGLESILRPPPLEASWDIIIDTHASDGYGGLMNKGSGMEEVEATDTGYLHLGILREAVSVADQFLEDANVGLSVEASNSEASGRYEDIEEIDEL
jgi:hypothetical protein